MSRGVHQFGLRLFGATIANFSNKTTSRLSMKQGSLFCFVTLRSPKPRHLMLCALGIFGKLSMSRGVHQFGLRLFGATMRKLLIIEPFFQ